MTIERASDNPFPSVLLVEGDPEALADNPASGQRRLAVGTDHLLYLVDDAGVATEVGGSGGGGSVVPNLILNYTQSSDISAVSMTNHTWVDILANQNFTVANAASLVEVSIRGMGFNNAGIGYSTLRAVIDSAGTPMNVPFAGYYTNNPQFLNAFTGTSPFFLSGLSAATHTIKLQCNVDTVGSAGAFYCRASSVAPYEWLLIQIVEHLPA
jgi:hypothetical protein